MKWKTTVYRVYKTLEDLSKQGVREVSILRLAVITGYSPTYLTRYVIPALAEVIPCIKKLGGKVIFECEGSESGGESIK